ncbi:glutamyl-tRNA amidotransferase [Mytilinidion resinicola]|uniref:Glutamyl-tRNA amidotransferase n=1 Tax=Mytilinidion resinicola TaxID=574789 RepID=A0A6A6YVF6_9PEZI|nr:glutamyl-tRNA amidotransferase [Mytilinidion resinicola]KAF2812363.1 glutamyl-tRNA amidotransferase [Mytilinidion resinicola]
MGPIARFLSVILSTSFTHVYAAFSSSGSTVFVNDIAYFVPPDVVGTLPSKIQDFTSRFHGSLGPVPITVITISKPGFQVSDLSALAANFSASDDVFQDGFLEALYVQYTGHGNPSAPQICSQNAAKAVIASSTQKPIPSGPYFVTSAGTLHRAYRLYSDFAGAFTETAISNSEGVFSVLPAGIVGQSPAVAVPSRLYFTKTVDKPLAGVRLGIKDIYDIAGLKTSNGNRAWYGLYPPANKTAVAVQKLIDAGAIVVGKMKTSQFANGETATADWVDYHEPFNPRGDGYQDTSSSSSGPGAGEGSYPWLDITLGSDTGGSIRGPSEVQGLYGNRPSHGLVELTGVMPLAPELDTSGLLTRDPVLWTAAAKALYGDNITVTSKYPSQILTVEFPESADDIADGLILDFLANLTDFLQANVTAFNFTTAWAAANPSAADINVILNTTYPLLISKEQIKLVRDPFYADYAAAHNGRRPFIDPTPLIRWSYGDNSSATIEEAVANKTQFMDWFNSEVLAPDAATCSSSLLLYVGSDASTVYRNVYWDSPGVPFGFSSGRISVFSEAPDFVVPIGQAPYNSTVTQHVEYLPVTVDMMVAKGCDGMLFSLIEALLAAGIIQVAKTGYSGIDGGEVLLKRSLEFEQ